MTFKKKIISQVVAVAICGTFAASAQAGFTVISKGGTSAAIDDAGYFSSGEPGGLGLSSGGIEYINHGTWASNYWFQYTDSASVVNNLIADQVTGSNPFSASVSAVSPSAAVNLDGGASGILYSQLTRVTVDGRVAVQVTLTNDTGSDITDAAWTVGFDPDQGIPGGFGFGTTNTVIGSGEDAAIKAVSMDGYSITLQNTTDADAVSVSTYIDSVFGVCCSPIDPSFAILNGQAVGFSASGDYSINLAFDFGTIENGDSVSFGYEYIMAVPEPETYAMLLAGLGLIGFSLRRRNA